MSNIKTEFVEQSLSSITTTPCERPVSPSSSKWDAAMELALLNAIAKCKPVGLHKHFRIMCVQRQFNEKSPLQCSISEIWDRLGEYYGVNALNELEEEDLEDEQALASGQGGENQYEFSLPLVFNSDPQQDTAIHAFEMPVSKRPRIHRRDVSPAVTESSVFSTPEPDEATPSRRTGRSTRKSEVGTPEPNTTRSSTTSPPSSFSSPSPSSSHSNRRSYRASSISKTNNATANITIIRRQSKRK